MPERDDPEIMIEQSHVTETGAGLLEITITGPVAHAAEAKALILRCIDAARRRAHMERLH